MKNKDFTFDSGKAKEFFLSKISFETSPNELSQFINTDIDNYNIVDVRTYDDYIDGHIPYAIHVPFDNLEEHLVMFNKDRINIVYSYCPYCKLAYKAAYEIAQKGYPVRVLAGGYKIWCKKGFDSIKNSSQD